MNFSQFIKKHNIISILLQLSAFAILFIISKLWLDKLYLFEWTARNYYFFIWLTACLFSFFGKNIIGVSVTSGAVLGVFIAQPLGEHIRAVNMSKITENTDPQLEAYLSSNPSWYIWFIIILAAFIVGIAITVINKIKNGKSKDIAEYIKKHHIISIAVQIVVFLLFLNMNFFGSISAACYWFALPLSCLLSFFGKNEIGVSAAVGTVIGIPISGLIYNHMQNADQWLIWIFLLAASCLIGVIITVLKSKRKINP